jgi:superfamily I DNA/RNA helicase
MITAAIWLLQVTAPGSNYSQQWEKGRRSHELGEVRDFKDDLWFTAIHADELTWPRYDVVLADEVQDFNQCHKVMLNKLHEAGAKIVAVGDPKQAIYRFNGADGQAFSNLGTMLTDLSHDSTDVVKDLTLNFRSQKPVLDFAKQECNYEVDPNSFLVAGRPQEDFDQEAQVSKYEREYGTTLEDLGAEFKRDRKLEQTAFIARTNAPLVQTALSLLGQGVPFVIVGRDVAGKRRSECR